MLKKDVTYVDFDGKECIDTFYFNLTKPEIVELEFSFKNGIEGELKEMLANEDRAGLLAFFKRVILASYGTKSADGKRFIKDDDATKEFTQTNAYAALYMELISDSNAAAAFVNGVVPSDLAQAIAAEDVQAKVAERLGIETVNTEGI